jgi:hypothetical protein
MHHEIESGYVDVAHSLAWLLLSGSYGDCEVGELRRVLGVAARGGGRRAECILRRLHTWESQGLMPDDAVVRVPLLVQPLEEWEVGAGALRSQDYDFGSARSGSSLCGRAAC